MFVKPAENPDAPGTLFVVRYPRTYQVLPADGAEVPQDQFWLRRVKHGDVVRCEPPHLQAAE